MGWSFRRSINVGPLRFNFSKSGVGYSLGVPGARIGKDGRNRKYSQLAIPRTGIYRRDYYTAAKPPQRAGLKPALSTRWLFCTVVGVLLFAFIRAIF
jgi:hypothetical protein